MVSFVQIKRGITNFVDREIIPNLSGAEKVIVGTGAGVIAAKLPDILKNYADHPILSAMGIIDFQQGMVDIETLYAAAKPYIGTEPISVKIPMVGVTLKMTQSEIDNLYRCIKEA